MSTKYKSKKLNKPTFTQWGDPVLHKPTKLVPQSEVGKPTFKKLVRKMFRTIQGMGVGLAANQIGLSTKLAVIEIKLTKPVKGLKSVPPTVVINPKITSYSRNKIGGWEGCLSCNGVRFWVDRTVFINITYINEHGEKIKRKVSGWEARVFQHEIDHLNGKVCGEQVVTENGKVASGAIISAVWYKKHPRNKVSVKK